MKHLYLIFLMMLTMIGFNAYTAPTNHLTADSDTAVLMAQARKAMAAGRTDEAKQLYLRAAALHDADAHFLLSYQFILPDSERIYHLIEASKGGQADALSSLFGELFFRAASPQQADPDLLYSVYETAKNKNPGLTFYNEETAVTTLRKCLEAGPFDLNAFFQKYGLSEEDFIVGFGAWDLAHEASIGGRFGKPDLRLTLQLVARGGAVPAELEGAVDAVYAHWKANEAFEFDPCDYVTSGVSAGFCARRAEEKADTANMKRIDSLIPILKNNAGKLLKEAYMTASTFIDRKVWGEEGHEGSMYAAMGIWSGIEQKNAFLALIQRVNKDSLPEDFSYDKSADTKLNQTYIGLLEKLKAKPIQLFNVGLITKDSIVNVEKQWLLYRDKTAHILATIKSDVSEADWKNWLTDVREKQLKVIASLDPGY